MEVVDGFSENVSEWLKKHPFKGPFRVQPVYSKVGDMLKVYFTDDPGYAEQISPQVTLIRSLTTKEIVGVKIMDIKAMVEQKEE